MINMLIYFSFVFLVLEDYLIDIQSIFPIFA